MPIKSKKKELKEKQKKVTMNGDLQKNQKVCLVTSRISKEENSYPTLKWQKYLMQWQRYDKDTVKYL